jgi:hypothetical protein
MPKERDNKAVVGRWFTDFWGKTYDPGVVDAIAARGLTATIGVRQKSFSGSIG